MEKKMLDRNGNKLKIGDNVGFFECEVDADGNLLEWMAYGQVESVWTETPNTVIIKVRKDMGGYCLRPSINFQIV